MKPGLHLKILTAEIKWEGCPGVSVWSGDSWKVKKESRREWTGRLGVGRCGEGEKIKEDSELDWLF